MRRSLTSIMAAATMLVAANVNAGEIYFVSPNGTGDGYSWEDAMSGDDLGATLKNAASGDIFYLMEGTYYNKTELYWTIPFGVTIKGGYPASSTGENVEITYPTGAETIFDADITGDGVGENTNMAYFQIAGNEDGYYSDVDKIVIEGITIKNAATGSDTEKVVSDYTGAAMYIDNAQVELSNVKFQNNVRVGDIETKICRGTIVVARGSWVYAHDCVWTGNVGQSAGVCFSMRQRGGGTDTSLGEESWGVTIFDRCYFDPTNGMEFVETTNNRYGGVVTLSDQAGKMYMNNCIGIGAGSKDPIIHSIGSFCRVGTNGHFYMTNTTLYNYYAFDAANHKGIISFGNTTQNYLANNIVVNPTDDAEADNGSVMWFQSASSVFMSGGYNIWGSTFASDFSNMQSTDSYGKSNNGAAVFGTNTASAEGLIAPLETHRKVSLDEIKALSTAWDLPQEIDLAVDYRGNKRPATTIPGAYDVNAETNAIDNIYENVGEAETISVEYYNIQGQRLNEVPQNGLYIQKALKADGTVKATKCVK